MQQPSIATHTSLPPLAAIKDKPFAAAGSGRP
jgi:hypothetical protein